MRLGSCFRKILLTGLCAWGLSSLPISATAAPAATQSNPCGFAPGDWCPAEKGDPCSTHPNATACRADPACYGVPYRGESVVACDIDERGFASNCPTIGCTSTPPRKAKQ
jgi:hypothetical protein